MIDKPWGWWTAEKVEEDRMEKDKEWLTQAQSRKKTIHLAAHIEANIHQAHKDKLKHIHNPPVTKQQFMAWLDLSQWVEFLA